MKITICGSMAFYNEMLTLKKDLEVLDHEVLIPSVALEVPGEGKYFGQYMEDNGGIDSFPEGHPLWQLKSDAISEHFEKIEKSDSILVANYKKKGVSGYVGGNTLIEIGLAFYLKKKIFIFNNVSSEISYKQEIMGMKPLFLNGDLSKIK